jgi:hypothetical protein
MEARSTTFEPGPANPQPHTITFFTQPSAGTGLTGIARDRYRALAQKVEELARFVHPLRSAAADNTDRIAAECRLQQLLGRRSDGGYELSEDDTRVKVARQDFVDKAEEQQRLNDLYEIRASSWRTASTLLATVNAWVREGQLSLRPAYQ